MTNKPNLKTDIAVFAFIIFLLSIAFSMFVLEKESDARLGLFAISSWILIIIGAVYVRQRRKNKND